MNAKLAVIGLLVMTACGGAASQTESSAAETAGLPDVSGNYTLNVYAPRFAGSSPAEPYLSGPMALFQSGGKVGGVAALRIPNPPDERSAAYSETRVWSGTIAKAANGAIVVRLADASSGNTLVGVLDASGNLVGSPGENHGYCTSTYVGFGCDALRSP